MFCTKYLPQYILYYVWLTYFKKTDNDNKFLVFRTSTKSTTVKITICITKRFIIWTIFQKKGRKFFFNLLPHFKPPDKEYFWSRAAMILALVILTFCRTFAKRFFLSPMHTAQNCFLNLFTKKNIELNKFLSQKLNFFKNEETKLYPLLFF